MKVLTATILGYLAGAGTVAGALGGWERTKRRPDLPRVAVMEHRPDSPSERLVFSEFLNCKLWITDGALWTKLGRGCSPDTVAQLVNIINQRDLRIAEARRGDCPQGTPPGRYIAELKDRAASEIQKTMGPAVASMVQDYEDASPQRQLVDDVNRILIYEDCPLTSKQTEMMVDLLKANAEPFHLTTKLDEIQKFIQRRQMAYDHVVQMAEPAMAAAQMAAFRKEFQMQIAYWEYFKMRQGEADDMTRQAHD